MIMKTFTRAKNTRIKLLGSVAAAALLAACSTAGEPGRMAAQPAAVSQNELTKATNYWASKFQANPTDATAAISYASNLKAMGKTKQALTVLQTGYTTNPRNAQLASEYGRLLLADGNARRAQQVLANAYDPARPDWKVVSAQGTAEAKLGNYKAAQTHFKKALDLSPDQPSVMNNLALAYALDGQASEAEGLLRKASEKNVANPKVKQNLALILGMQGRFKEAESVSSTHLESTKVAGNMQYLRRMVKAMPADEGPDQAVVADVPAAIGGGSEVQTEAADNKPMAITPPQPAPVAEQEAPLRGTTKVAEQSNGWGSTVTVADADVSAPVEPAQ